MLLFLTVTLAKMVLRILENTASVVRKNYFIFCFSICSLGVLRRGTGFLGCVFSVPLNFSPVVLGAAILILKSELGAKSSYIF